MLTDEQTFLIKLRYQFKKNLSALLFVALKILSGLEGTSCCCFALLVDILKWNSMI